MNNWSDRFPPRLVGVLDVFPFRPVCMPKATLHTSTFSHMMGIMTRSLAITASVKKRVVIASAREVISISCRVLSKYFLPICICFVHWESLCSSSRDGFRVIHLRHTYKGIVFFKRTRKIRDVMFTVRSRVWENS